MEVLHAIPNAPGNEISAQQLVDGSVAIQVPAGIYDWVVCYPYTEGDTYMLAMWEEYFPTYVDDFEFVAGYTYHFEACDAGNNDRLKLNIIEGLEPADEVKEVTIRFEAGEHCSLTGQTEYTVWSTTAIKSSALPKAVAEEGYVFKGWEPAFVPNSTIKDAPSLRKPDVPQPSSWKPTISRLRQRKPMSNTIWIWDLMKRPPDIMWARWIPMITPCSSMLTPTSWAT